MEALPLHTARQTRQILPGDTNGLSPMKDIHAHCATYRSYTELSDTSGRPRRNSARYTVTPSDDRVGN